MRRQERLQFKFCARIAETDDALFEIGQLPVGKASAGFGFEFSYDEISLFDNFIRRVNGFAGGRVLFRQMRQNLYFKLAVTV